jgi:hypothetical protein
VVAEVCVVRALVALVANVAGFVKVNDLHLQAVAAGEAESDKPSQTRRRKLYSRDKPSEARRTSEVSGATETRLCRFWRNHFTADLQSS